jgi:hypothetical protein
LCDKEDKGRRATDGAWAWGAPEVCYVEGGRGAGGGGLSAQGRSTQIKGGGEGDFARATIGLRDPWWSPEVCRQMLPKLSLT